MSALDQLGDLRRAGLAKGLDARRLHDTLAELPVRLGERTQPDRVLVATPEQIRARRFEAVFVCGLQEGEFPRGRRPSRSCRTRTVGDREGQRARLPVREDELERERYLFYVCASRAERAVFLSSRFSDEEGNPQPGSFFLEDARDLFTEIEPRRRSLSDVVWDPRDAPTEVEWERTSRRSDLAAAPGGPDGLTAAELLQQLGSQDAFSASALETFADCPVSGSWTACCAPRRSSPTRSRWCAAGTRTRSWSSPCSRLRERSGARRVTRENLPEAGARSCARRCERGSQSSGSRPKQTRVHAACGGSSSTCCAICATRPSATGCSSRPSSSCASACRRAGYRRSALDEEGISIRGVIDRVDTWCDTPWCGTTRAGPLGLPGGGMGGQAPGSRRPST